MGERERKGWWRESHGIPSTVLLLGADDCPVSLSRVEGGFATDDGLALNTTTTGFGSDLRYCIPVIHGGDCNCALGVEWMGGEVMEA